MLLAMLPAAAEASETHGQVHFNGLPVPGAVVFLSQGGKKLVTITDQQGLYSFPGVEDGTWTIHIEVAGFDVVNETVTVSATGAAGVYDLKLQTLEHLRTLLKPSAGIITSVQQAKIAPSDEQTTLQTVPDAVAQNASDGLLVNGSVNNAATSKYTQSAAFGNTRSGGRALYNGGIGFTMDNSALDAQQYSLSGLVQPKPTYNDITGLASIGGPINIPHLIHNGPSFFLLYQWTRNNTANVQSGIVPDANERAGNFAQEMNSAGQPILVYNPATNMEYTGDSVPVSTQAAALLNLYPMPNLVGSTRYNYQTQVIDGNHQDAVQLHVSKSLNFKNQIFGDFNMQSLRSSTPNLFHFTDTSDVLGINTGINWSYRIRQRLGMTLGYRLSRLSSNSIPYWENRQNVSLNAGITGNNQDAMNWGPPTLGFSSITGLSDGNAAFDRNRTDSFTAQFQWNKYKHNLTFGGEVRRQEFNYLSQTNPRGTFTFTGAATQGTSGGSTVGGSDIADFLVGTPDASALAEGNAQKYLRESVYNLYATDDWRINAQVSVSAGARWEYSAPMTELYDHIANLDIANGFTADAPVLASNPIGPVTNVHYPTSLVWPDHALVEPRIGVSIRPIAGASTVIRTGYGMYADSSVYQTITLGLAQQFPGVDAKNLSVQNSSTCPLTLANGFLTCSAATTNYTFAIDPHFRVGYAQTWNFSVQQDLPFSMQMVASYLGVKGLHGNQEIIPNSYPIGGTNPCPGCPNDFAYLSSNGTSMHEEGSLELRRRLHNGFTATVTYKYAKSVDDDAALGGQGPVAAGITAASGGSLAVAQNWMAPDAERSRSSFDQRNLLTATAQYTSGMGLGGRTLMTGWRGRLLKEWTIFAQINAGSGMPETPIYLAAVPGAGSSTIMRPSLTGQALYAATAGYFLNAGAYTTPVAGQWGTAGRNSIEGPGTFTMNNSLARTFRLNKRYNLDLRVDANNTLNHVTFSGWNTTWSSSSTNSQFGLPTAANNMRSLKTTLRLRF